LNFVHVSKVGRILAIEVMQIGLGVVVVLMEVEGKGIVERAIAEEAVRVEREGLRLLVVSL
jgi:hypothetical protein